MLPRRLTVAAIVLIVSAGLIFAMVEILIPGGWTVAKAAMLISCACAAPWVGFCAANGLIGFALRPHRPAMPPPDLIVGDPPRTAIAVTIRNEDVARVLQPLRRLLDGLDAAFAGDSFALFLLSDTGDGDTAAVEAREAGDFAASDRVPARVQYRRRTENSGFKAGNIMEFLDHHASGFVLMLVLDADSEMTADAVLRLVKMMRDDPRLGIAQHLTVGLPASSCFPRLFQFGMRAGMRTWATSLSWWQDDSCVYWGHNALIRIDPFRAHCRLPLLPNGDPILSHDQVEAAMLRGAGWGIRLLAEEDGSYEANPPALPEFMRRELRWLQGNFEYRHLLRMKGLRPMGRWQLIQAILLFACTPFYLIFMLASAWAAATDKVSAFPFRWALVTTVIWAGALYAPKLLGYLELLISRQKRALYGGALRITISALLEILFTLLLDAINTWAKTIVSLRIALGWRAVWLPQNRNDRGVSWSEAARLLWPQTVLGVALLFGYAQAGWVCVAWAAPFVIGLVLAIPFCVISANPVVGAWLQRNKVAAIPEERTDS